MIQPHFTKISVTDVQVVDKAQGEVEQGFVEAEGSPSPS